MDRETRLGIDMSAVLLVDEAIATLSSGGEVEIPVYSDVSDASAVLPERYSHGRDRGVMVGEAVDSLLDIDENGQGEYITGSNNPRELRYHWQIAASRRHPGLYAVSEIAMRGIMVEMVARRGSILVSPALDLTDTNSANFNRFFENVIKRNR